VRSDAWPAQLRLVVVVVMPHRVMVDHVVVVVVDGMMVDHVVTVMDHVMMVMMHRLRRRDTG